MTRKRIYSSLLVIFLSVLSLLFISPIFIVLMNAFKGQFYIADAPFALPNTTTFVGLANFVSGIEKIGFFSAFLYSLFITVASVAAILLFTSMTAWYLTRVRALHSRILYYVLIFSMIVPFQMVMFTMSRMANVLHLENPVGIILIYLGFGAGLAVFMYCGFIRGIPLAIEEAAEIDGCKPPQTFFWIIFPILRPITVTVAVLNAMWIWNDYLLPALVIGSSYRTIPVAVQYLQGGYGSRDIGALMAMLILSIIPIVVFYALMQKHIIRGVVAGAIKE